MKRKGILSVISLMFVLLACNCKTLTSTRNTSTSTVPPSQLPGDQRTATPQMPPAISIHDAPFNISWDDRSLFKKRLTSSYQGILSRLPGASIYHLGFSLSNPPTLVKGVEEVRYTNQESVVLEEVDFAIYSEILGGDIHVSQVLLDGQPVTPLINQGLMRIPLADDLVPGSSIIFHIEFEITVPALGGNFYYGIFGYNNGILSLAQAYPTILVFDEQGWHNRTPDLDGDPLFSDTSFYLVSIDAPGDMILVASGAEVNHQTITDRQHVLYADGPARDFYLAAGTDLVKTSKKVGETTIDSFTPAGLNQFAQSALNSAEAAITNFSHRYGPYPYTEFSIVPIVTSAGGVEFPGLTAVAENAYNAGSFLEVVVVHEVAHQWFYNLVGNDTQLQPWLDESLVQFVTCQYFLDAYGKQAEQFCQDEMQANWDGVEGKKIPIGKPVSDYTSAEYVAIIYGRGPLFFFSLRQEIGLAAFDNLMNDYAKSFAWDIATASGFQKLAEQHCNCGLTPIFNEWVYP